ncbi:MAG: hypothetical protein ACJ8HC_14995 [Paraburkholderia graminis]|jgi:hypothetical protein|uniref:hypothetical protein n=1 Tax=Paraburkholderia TaxID=1822464 RepID=UPI003524E226
MYNDPDLPPVRGDYDDAARESDAADVTGTAPRFGRLALCVAAASALAFGVVGTVAYSVWFNSDQQTYAEAIARARQALRMPAPGNAATVLAKSSEVNGNAPDTRPATTTPSAASVATTPFVTSAIGAPARSPGSAPATASVTAPAVAPNTPADSIALLDLPAMPAQASASTADDNRKPSTWAGQIIRPQQDEVEEVLADDGADAPSTLAAARGAARPAMQATAGPAEAPAPELASSRPAREAKYAPQERRASANGARRKGNLFTKMGSFFRRISYRQHGSGSQQDLYSHP